MVDYTDQMLRTVAITKPPVRIISLVPSITELLADLGLENEIAGITKFCVHPETLYRSKTHIGGTKKIDHAKIASLEPDLILAGKEENNREDIELLEKKYPVWVSDVKTMQDALDMITEIGKITDRKNQAEELSRQIVTQFKTLVPLNGISTLYLIWKNPFMAAGGDTYIHDMLQLNGMQNILQDKSRYPSLTIQDLVGLKPELLLFSSEPYPFKENDMHELREFLPHCLMLSVDGEYFSWYGSRLAGAPSYFNALNETIKHHLNIAVEHKQVNEN